MHAATESSKSPRVSLAPRGRAATRAPENPRVATPPPYCRANITPTMMRGYMPCMLLLPCPVHGDNPSFHDS